MRARCASALVGFVAPSFSCSAVNVPLDQRDSAVDPKDVGPAGVADLGDDALGIADLDRPLSDVHRAVEVRAVRAGPCCRGLPVDREQPQRRVGGVDPDQRLGGGP